MDSKFIKLLQSASLLLFTISTVVFISLTSFDYSYFVGWVVGAFAALAGHLTIYYAFRMLSNDKKHAVVYAMLRQGFNLVLQGVIFLAIVMINNASNGNSLFGGTTDDMLWPINVITYIAGFSSVWFAFLFNFTIKKGL